MPMGSCYSHHAARTPKVLGRGKVEEVFEGGKGDDETTEEGGTVAGAFHKPVIERICLTISEVSWGLGMLLGVMAGEIWSSHH